MNSLIFSILALTLPAVDGEVVKHRGESPLYSFTLRQRVEEGRQIREAWFKLPDGTPQVFEQAVYERNALRRYLIKQFQTEEEGWVEISGNELNFRFQKDGRVRTRTEDLQEPTLVVDQLPGFVESHWDELSSGAKLRFQFVIVSRLSTMEFEIRKDAQKSTEDRVHFVMRPRNFLFRLFSNPIRLTFSPKPHIALTEVEGRLPLFSLRGDHWVPFQGVLSMHPASSPTEVAH